MDLITQFGHELLTAAIKQVALVLIAAWPKKPPQ
jgi:hypothetical protein